MRNETIIRDWHILYAPVWHDDFEKRSLPAELPGIWQTQNPDYEGAAYYWRKFDFTEADLQVALRLRFGAVNYRAEVSVNGQSAAVHEGGYTAFEARLDRFAHPGENLVSVRVVCPPRLYPFEGLQASCPIRQTPVPSWKTGWYYPFGGIWQEVKLIRSPKIFVADAFVMPEIEPASITVEVTLSEKAAGPLKFRVDDFGGGETEARDGRASFRLEMPGAALWSPERPALHTLAIEFNGETTEWRFGLRKFTCSGNRFLLNGKPIYLRSVLQQGLYPATIAAPPDKEFARRELEMLKKANVNMVRAHLKPTPEFVLDMYDEAGIMVIAEPPVGWVSYDDKVEQRVRDEIEFLVRRDRNHPCVVLWTFFNEFTDTVYSRYRDPAKLVRECCELGIRLDPTRLVTGNSGSSPNEYAAVGTGIFGQNLAKPLPLVDKHIYCRAPLAPTEEKQLREMRPPKEGTLAWISEFGTSCFPDMDELLAAYGNRTDLVDFRQNRLYRDSLHRAYVDFGLAEHFGSEREFYRLLGVDQKLLINAMLRDFRVNPALAGYDITQWADAASEWGGVVDLFRNPKASFEVFARNNADVIAVIVTEKSLFYAGETAKISLHLSNVGAEKLDYQGVFKIFREGTEVFRKEVRGSGGITLMDEISFSFRQAGTYRLELTGDAASDSVEVVAAPSVLDRLPEFSLLENTAPPRQNPSPLREKLEKLGVRPAVQFEQFNPPPDVPAVVHCKGKLPSLRIFRALQVLRREVEEEGKTAIFIDCDLAELGDFFGEDRPMEFYAVGCYSGNSNFALDDGIFRYAVENRCLNSAYSMFYPHATVDADYLKSRNYRLHSVGVHPEQFGITSQVQYGSFLASKKLGKGRVVLCAMRIFDRIGVDPAADDLLLRLLTKFV